MVNLRRAPTGMATLRPCLVQTLREFCNPVKVKRLFCRARKTVAAKFAKINKTANIKIAK